MNTSNITGLIFSLILLWLALGAFMIIIGYTHAGKRMVFVAIAGAVVAPFVLQSLSCLSLTLQSLGVPIGIVLGLVILIIFAVSKQWYTKRKRTLLKNREEKPTSQKKRVSRD